MSQTGSNSGGSPEAANGADAPGDNPPPNPPQPLPQQPTATAQPTTLMTATIQPPESFDFKKPESWARWIRRFERFRLATSLNRKEGAVQVSTLVYAMGGDAEDILQSFGLDETAENEYDTVKARFQAHFIKRHNPIFERARFNQRTQQPGETVDAFITALYKLVEHCEYGSLREQMIRDRLVVGLRDANLSERLQLESSLDLRDAVQRARNSESVKSQQTTVRASGTTGTASSSAAADAIHGTQRRQNSSKFQQQKGGSTQPKRYPHSRGTPPASSRDRYESDTPTSCKWCGKSPHRRDRCPAKTAKCGACGKLGHFAKVCLSSKPSKPSRSIREIEADDEAFLGAIDSEKAWETRVFLAGVPLTMKIDTGADVTAISDTVYTSTLHSSPPLSRGTRLLRGPDGRTLDVAGSFNTSLSLTSSGDSSSRHTVYVVRGLKVPLLGRPAITALHVLQTLGTVDAPTSQCYNESYVVDNFPQLLSGLGELKGEPYKIRLRDDAVPFSLSTPRRVSLPLRDAVSTELQRMVDQDVIRKVDEPTDWCAGMVVVPKPDGRVRLCGDFTNLNLSVRRERHLLPSIEHLLADVHGAKYFTKLDANSGFHQIPLDRSSQLLTTFITPAGRYCYKRLPFGISSAPEHFQKRMTAILDGCPGLILMMDDILIFGATPEEHNERLTTVLRRLAKAGVTLNRAKCIFGETQVRFCGYLLDATGIRPDPAKISALVDMPPCKNVSDVRRFLGMANQLGRFSPSLATLSQPLRELLVKGNAWLWDTAHQTAFENIKADLSSATVLAMYSPSSDTCVAADASSFGLGAVITQLQPNGEWRPIAFQSRSMTPTEQRYSQIEKEALAATWACERFSHYLVGLPFRLETDHKPLVPLLSTKRLDELPPRIIRFRLRLMRYSFTIHHVPGKDLVTADAPLACARALSLYRRASSSSGC